MIVWSSIQRNLIAKSPGILKSSANLLCQKSKDLVVKQVRHGGHGPKTFVITPSNWQWDKFKDLVHFYLMIGFIPVIGVVTYTNIFIGPAKLAPIPENYEPKHWEYHRHPITRFFARYIVANPQQEYEKFCHDLYEEKEAMKLRQLEKDVKRKMAERLDYQAWYYRPAMVKYARQNRKFFEEHEIQMGS